jgi:hypothetical protein
VALSIVAAAACSNQNEENAYPAPQSSEALLWMHGIVGGKILV